MKRAKRKRVYWTVIQFCSGKFHIDMKPIYTHTRQEDMLLTQEQINERCERAANILSGIKEGK